MSTRQSRKAALRRKYHVRKKTLGTPDRPRLSVFRSNKHMYAQVIDDIAAATLVSASTRSTSIRQKIDKYGNKQAAELVGEELAKQAAQVGIKRVRFDRNRFKYHGRVRALADAARKNGLVF